MRRREVFKVIGGATTFWALAASAQQTRVTTIGVLVRGAPGWQQFWESFREALRQLGYIEGKNVRFEFRSDQGEIGRLPELAAELVRLNDRAVVHAGRNCRQTGNARNPGRLRGLWRHGRNRVGREPRPARRKCHGLLQPER